MSNITLSDGTQMDDMLAIAKSRLEPGQLNPGGELKPQQATKLISLVTGSDFLKRVSTHAMRKIEADGMVFDIPSRSLVRTDIGREPTETQKVQSDSFPYTLRSERASLFTDVSVEWLQDNQDNPNLLEEINAGFGRRITGELVDLAFNGTGVKNNTGATAKENAFLALNKGWIKIAKEATNTPKVDINPTGDTGWIDAIASVVEKMPGYFRSTAVMLMSVNDRDRYSLEVGKYSQDKTAIADEKQSGFLGYSVLAVPQMPDGHLLYTPLKNLIFGLNTTVTRHREFKPRRQVIEYTWHMRSDFEIAAKQACVLGQPASS